MNLAVNSSDNSMKKQGGGNVSNGKMKLYSYFRSSCSWRLRIALEYKELNYEIVPISLMTQKQVMFDAQVHRNFTAKFRVPILMFEEEYVKINPMGQVPALVLEDKHILLQSIAIIEYLEEVYPDKPLLPKDPLKRAKVREISELIASGIQPLQNLNVLDHYSDKDTEKLKWAQFWIQKGLTALEEILSHCAGKYSVGNDISMADCCLIPQIANAHRFKVDISGFPTITRLESTLSAIPAFERAHASKQPDCPPEMYSML